MNVNWLASYIYTSHSWDWCPNSWISFASSKKRKDWCRNRALDSHRIRLKSMIPSVLCKHLSDLNWNKYFKLFQKFCASVCVCHCVYALFTVKSPNSGISRKTNQRNRSLFHFQLFAIEQSLSMGNSKILGKWENSIE